MEPHIDGTLFGSITVEGKTYDHDIVIHRNGLVEKRKKKLTKQLYGTAHIVSVDEAEAIYEKGTEEIVIGTGQSGCVKISNEAADFFREHGCHILKATTPEALRIWNEEKGAVVGLFHVTC